VQIGDPVHILGFPGVVLAHEAPEPERDPRGLRHNGAVSGFKVDVINQTSSRRTRRPRTATAAARHHRRSDGRRRDAVRVASSSARLTQGFNFLIPARDVGKFLQGPRSRSPATAVHRGLGGGHRGPFGQRYKAAVVKLTEANELVPNLTDVKHSLNLAQERSRTRRLSVPVGTDDDRRDARERRGLRQHVG